MDRAQVLFIQHAGAMGGSARSLFLTIKYMDSEKYNRDILFIRDAPEVLRLYSNMGIETRVTKGISTFEHTTLRWYKLYRPYDFFLFLKEIGKFIPSVRKTEAIVKEINPSIVHLNSLVLSPSAWGVKRAGVPIVWHIREPVARGHFGIRKSILRAMVQKLADESIFISEYDRNELVGHQSGTVVPNFVDAEYFNIEIDRMTARESIGLNPREKIILFLGGLSKVKGVFTLLNALPLAKKEIVDLSCIFAGAIYPRSSHWTYRLARKILPLFGCDTISQRVDKTLRNNGMEGYVHMLPWRHDVEWLIAACDLVVFPSIEPHFARPVIEAGAMGKPVVASRIGGVEELVEDGVTGILVKPGDPEDLARALVKVLSDEELANRMGAAGRKRALERYSVRNVKMIEEVYERLLKDGRR